MIISKYSFTGYFVDYNYQGQGIARQMGRTMLRIAWTNHFRIFATVSCNNSQALGCGQIEQLDFFIREKRKLVEKHKAYFADKSGVTFFMEPESCRLNYWLNAVILKDRNARDEFLQFTNDHEIMTRPIWVLSNKLDMYRGCQCGDLTNECFLPVQTVVRQWSYRKVKVEVPLIAGMIFVRVGRQEQLAVLQTRGVVAFLRLKGEEGPAVIPDRQMETFRFLLDFSEEAVEMSNENIWEGDLIVVIKGPLKGMEGELIRLKGVTKVLVQIDMVGCTMVNIPASFVEKLNKTG